VLVVSTALNIEEWFTILRTSVHNRRESVSTILLPPNPVSLNDWGVTVTSYYNEIQSTCKYWNTYVYYRYWKEVLRPDEIVEAAERERENWA